jgi:hypothetical protein
MSAIFKEQSLFVLKLETGINITGATEKKILYEKPDGTKASWEATSVESNTIMCYQLNDGDIDQPGNWKFQSYVVNGGKKGYGLIVTEYVEENLSPDA